MSTKQNTIDAIKKKFNAVAPFMNEKTVRLWCAAEAQSIGHGGITLVANATLVSKTTIRKGIIELSQKSKIDSSRVRVEGGGRKSIIATNPQIVKDLEQIIQNKKSTAIKWTSKSMQQIANTLSFKGYDVSSRTVNRLLKRIGYKVCRKQQNFSEQCKYLNKKIENAKQHKTPILYISLVKKTKNRTTTSSELRSNSKNLLLNSMLSTKSKQHLMINSLLIWKKHFANSFSKSDNILILTEYLEPKNAQFWLQSLLHFSKKYNVSISVHHIPQGITKWVLPMNKFSVIYPYENSQNKRETYEVNVCFNTTVSDTVKKTVINNTPLVEFDLPKVVVKRQRFLGDFNYQIKDCETKRLH